MADNVHTIIGSTGHDVSLKFLDSGRAVGNVSVAVSRRWKDKRTQEDKEVTSWFDVVLYGKMAENAQASCPKGTRVIVTGRMDQRSWETQDGSKRTVLEIIADEFAPSLSFATAVVTRNPREDSGGYREQTRAPAQSRSSVEDPW